MALSTSCGAIAGKVWRARRVQHSSARDEAKQKDAAAVGRNAAQTLVPEKNAGRFTFVSIEGGVVCMSR